MVYARVIVFGDPGDFSAEPVLASVVEAFGRDVIGDLMDVGDDMGV